MRHIELGMAMLTITGMAWARVHHWRADRRTDTEGEPCTDE